MIKNKPWNKPLIFKLDVSVTFGGTAQIPEGNNAGLFNSGG
jgi:hypothetical protein